MQSGHRVIIFGRAFAVYLLEVFCSRPISCMLCIVPALLEERRWNELPTVYNTNKCEKRIFYNNAIARLHCLAQIENTHLLKLQILSAVS